MNGIPFVYSMLEKLGREEEKYGEGRLFTDRARGDPQFSAVTNDVIQYYCRLSSLVTGRINSLRCPVQLYAKMRCARRGWQVTWKGQQNYDRIPASEKLRQYDALRSLMGVDEIRFHSASEEKLSDRTLQARPVRGTADEGCRVGDSGDTEREMSWKLFFLLGMRRKWVGVGIVTTKSAMLALSRRERWLKC